MVSIDNGKRYKPIDEERSKKLKFSGQTDINFMVSLNSSVRTESLSKLRLLFPLKSIEELVKILDQSNDSFEYALGVIQKQEQEKYVKACIFKTAQDMVFALGSAKNSQEAYEITKDFLENCKKPEDKEIEELNSRTKDIAGENKLLKRAVVKLYENSVEASGKDMVIEGLKKKLENEKMKVCCLGMRLNQEVNKHKFSSDREFY